MKIEFQSLSWAEPRIKKIFENNHKRGEAMPSLSRIFKHLRKHPRFTLFGDYPLLSFAIKTMVNLGARIDRNKILRALRYSKDYKTLETKKQKMETIDCLLKLLLV